LTSLAGIKLFCHFLFAVWGGAAASVHACARAPAGVVHRDLKLENVLMTAEGAPIICDFGISKEDSSLLDGTLSTESTATLLPQATGSQGAAAAAAATAVSFVVKGTKGYIAPEVPSPSPPSPWLLLQRSRKRRASARASEGGGGGGGGEGRHDT
jgi:serine/threonine protein kinase